MRPPERSPLLFYEHETTVGAWAVRTLGYDCCVADGTGGLRDTVVAVSGIYADDGRLLYRECNEKADAEDVRRQHDGIVAGVQDGRIRLTAPAQREQAWALDRGRGRTP